LFLPALLKPRSMAMRAQLWALHRGVVTPELPGSGVVSLSAPQGWPAGFAGAMGWIEAGPMWLRMDVVEKIAAELGWSTRSGAAVVPHGLASRLSIRSELLSVVLRRLGFRIVPGGGLGPEEYGPPAPAMLVPLRRRRPAVAIAAPAKPVVQGPFAVLAALKR
jgi:ATP-dependent RNA helicase SUPV3L1/SUV3